MYLFTSMLTPLMGLRGFCSGLVLPGPACLNCPNDQGRQRWWAPCFLAPKWREERGPGALLQFVAGEVWLQPLMRLKASQGCAEEAKSGRMSSLEEATESREQPAGSWDAQRGRPRLWPGICPEEVEEHMHTAHWQWRCWVLAEGKSRPGKGMWLEGQREHNCVKEQTLEWQKSRGDLLYIINYVPVDWILPDDNTIYSVVYSHF